MAELQSSLPQPVQNVGLLSLPRLDEELDNKNIGWWNREASGYLKIAEKTPYRFLREHNIPAFKLQREWGFKRSLLDAWMEKKMEFWDLIIEGTDSCHVGSLLDRSCIKNAPDGRIVRNQSAEMEENS